MSESSVNLQATLQAASAPISGSPLLLPHHPITCAAALSFDEDNVLACPHAKTEPDDPRTLQAIRHSVAIMLIEEAFKL